MKKKYKVAVVLYEADNEQLLFLEEPEALYIEKSICEVPGDITAVAAIVARRAEKIINEYEQEVDTYEPEANV